jgi:hypothetical protein
MEKFFKRELFSEFARTTSSEKFCEQNVSQKLTHSEQHLVVVLVTPPSHTMNGSIAALSKAFCYTHFVSSKCLQCTRIHGFSLFSWFVGGCAPDRICCHHFLVLNCRVCGFARGRLIFSKFRTLLLPFRIRWIAMDGTRGCEVQ